MKKVRVPTLRGDPGILGDISVPENWGNPEGEAPVSMDVPEASVAPILPIEPMIATLISTSMGRGQRMGAVYVLTMTTLMGIMNLKALSMAVGCQGATVEELAKEDLAEGHP